MKPNLKIVFIVLFLKIAFIVLLALTISGCSDDDQTQQTPPQDLVNTLYPEAEQEIMAIFTQIRQNLIDGDMDGLIDFHAYSPKFTEFKNGELRNGSVANEAYEREVFGAVTEVVKFETNDLKVSVYGDVANATFHSDFHLKFGENLAIVREQTSLLFVKTANGWKIVNEHHSPLNE